MQTPALPAPAHTRPRALHWLVTATATAAVVAGAALLQPAAATASQTPPAAQSAPGPARALPAPDAKAAAYPLKCRSGKTVLLRQAGGDLDGDHNPETVAAVRCDSGIGTPPSAVYVLTGANRVVATLVEASEEQNVTELAVTDGSVTATLLGYSSDAVARCCPDKTQKVKWQWRNGKFTRSATTEARSV
ncbi:hypothetical protein ACFYVL_24610 [Streptomyces sp. NPDC004111]|uniref:hypothetical protein n=1 Tax=Streptomyces sp. NPDC004111 TaxID=3364690 RepID=UPI0036B457CB